MDIYKMDDFNPENMKKILDKYIREGNVPQAMMWYRRLYNVGIKEAKESVEALMAGKPTYEELEAKIKSLQEERGELEFALAAIAHDPFDSRTWYDYCKSHDIEPLFILTPEQKERGWSTWQLSYKAIAEHALKWLRGRTFAA